MKILKYKTNPVIFITVIFLFIAQMSWSQEHIKNISEQSIVTNSNSSSLKWGPCPEFMPNGCEIAVLHGDPAKENLDILFKLPPNTDIPEHWHNSAERIILLSGELTITYKGEDTKTIKLGDYVYGPAQKSHNGRCGNSGPCVLFIGFEKPLDAFAVNK